MPSFTSQVANLENVGPIVELNLTLSSSLETQICKDSQTIPAPISITGLIDTGATRTVIQQGLAKKLGLLPVGTTLISTPSSTNVNCYEYFVKLILPNQVSLETTAIEAPMQGQHIQCLIGRDVLAHAVLVYIGYTNIFTLSF